MINFKNFAGNRLLASSLASFSIFDLGEDGIAADLGLSSDVPGSLRQHSWIVEVYDEFRPSLYRYLICIGLPTQQADDIIQDAFLQLFAQVRAKGKPENVQGWVFRVAQNLSRSSQAREGRLVSDHEDEGSLSQRADPAMNPEETCLWSESQRRLAERMSELTDQQRQCINLRAEGLRYREIGKALGISTSRVAQLLQRAIGRLAEDNP